MNSFLSILLNAECACGRSHYLLRYREMFVVSEKGLAIVSVIRSLMIRSGHRRTVARSPAGSKEQGLRNRDAERFGRSRLTTSSNLIGSTTESSFGFSSLNILPTKPVVSVVMDRTLRTATAKLAIGSPERVAYCAYLTTIPCSPGCRDCTQKYCT